MLVSKLFELVSSQKADIFARLLLRDELTAQVKLSLLDQHLKTLKLPKMIGHCAFPAEQSYQFRDKV
jgi:hypothetical protein